MNNFNFCVPTEIFFGKGQISVLPQVLEKYGKNVLLAYGGGSIKKNGIYDEIQQLIKNFNLIEFAGINPNPRIESVREGIELCKKHNIDVILAVGGGSVIDCSKVVACGTYYNGDAWDIMLNPLLATKALPIVTVLTLAATGSEMNANAVITNFATNEKLGAGLKCTLPKVSILDPQYLYTLPAIQTAAGTADIMSHIFETYFNTAQGAFIADRICEELLKTCIKYCKIALEDPKNYEARANLMWAATLALNGLCKAGKNLHAWTCHPIEHEISAYYDITHGTGLAILTPRWMRYILNEKTVDKFVEYAVNVWGLTYSQNKFFLANEAIDLTEQFLKNSGIPMTLSKLKIDTSKFDVMAKKSVKTGNLKNAYVSLNEEDVKKLLLNCI